MHGDGKGERHGEKTKWTAPSVRGMAVPVEGGCRACSTVVGADERQSARQPSGFAQLRHSCSHFPDVIDAMTSSKTFARSKHPSDKIIEIIHPTTATSTRQKKQQEKETTVDGGIYSSSSFFFDLLGRSCRRVSSRILFHRRNITYSWINMGYNTTLANYDIAE
jgi:hypothetical protein